MSTYDSIPNSIVISAKAIQSNFTTMTVTFKKAGEAVASKVIQTGKTAAKAAAARPTMEVKPPHAVNKAEAPHMIPGKDG